MCDLINQSSVNDEIIINERECPECFEIMYFDKYNFTYTCMNEECPNYDITELAEVYREEHRFGVTISVE